MMTMRNSSYLRPFSAMYITVVPDGEYVNVTQIDRPYVVESLDVNLDDIAYAAVASEPIQELFAMYDVDRKVFDTVVNYSKQIRRRNVQLGTIMLGWQLLSLAGIVPSANAFTHQDGIDPCWLQVRETTNLPYFSFCKSWITTHSRLSVGAQDAPIELPKTIWKELEKLLFRIL